MSGLEIKEKEWHSHSQTLCEGGAELERGMLILVEKLIQGSELCRGMTVPRFLL